MSSRTVISVENLGKSYCLSHQAELRRYNALRDVIADKFRELFRPRSRQSHRFSSTEEFWALKNVSFEVRQGEVIGIIGRNGAGKSTLLKILSRITEPSEGRVRIKGRVASLLEVGTGFHPELTGRENIYLNGTILGMSRAEIKKKFDEIVAFAEVEKFLDTPVKHYSSGMFVRLAFAVAAHLEPEILIVDEVLAVGDAEFQKKCLGKMRDVSTKEGRTILFVSHNMGAIQSLCGRVILLSKGRVGFEGEVKDAVSRYLQTQIPQVHVDTLEGVARQGTGEAQIKSIRLMDDASNPCTHFRMGEPLNVVVRVHFFSQVRNPLLGFNLMTDTGIMVADCRSSHSNVKLGLITGDLEYHMRIEALMLYPKTYVIEPWVTDEAGFSVFDWVHDAMAFVVTTGSNFLSGANINANQGISFIATSCAIQIIKPHALKSEE
ncbi:MAG: ABC transporter ATP-binding protein [Methylacidiphilales bacterium]|nr:ABC transporter ATP-binding protein [Candidatus Methylacidiphilales bacterium]